MHFHYVDKLNVKIYCVFMSHLRERVQSPWESIAFIFLCDVDNCVLIFICGDFQIISRKIHFPSLIIFDNLYRYFRLQLAHIKILTVMTFSSQ